MRTIPKVSVVCVTFNQQNYIAKAIESILCQETNFNYELIVHDDASTDRTPEVIKNLSDKYPGRIVYIRQANNMYSQGERIFELACSYAVGELIALCEGDDYWVSNDRLQKQFDYLQLNPECGAVFGDSNIYFQDTGRLISAHDASRDYIPLSGDVRKSLLTRNPYKTCTVMLRKEAMQGYAFHAKKLHAKMDDYVVWLHISMSYEIGYIPNVLGTYRVLQESASHFSDWRRKIFFDRSAYKVALYFNNLMGELVEKKKIRTAYCYSLFCFFIDTGRIYKALGFFEFSRSFLFLLFHGVERRTVGFLKKLTEKTSRTG